jgi:Na+/H+-dicarboxylate symporter
MEWLLLVLFGVLFGRALMSMGKSERRAVRKTYHAFRALTAKRRSSKLYHFLRLFD